jgi:hypothetical protein
MIRCFSAEGICPCSSATSNSGKIRSEALLPGVRRGLDVFARLLDGSDARTDDVRLLLRPQALADEFVGLVAVLAVHPAGDDRPPARRALLDHRDVQIAERGHRQRPRDRRGGHDQAMRGAVLAQLGPLVDAELVLLVDDHHPQMTELDVFWSSATVPTTMSISPRRICESNLACAWRRSCRR